MLNNQEALHLPSPLHLGGGSGSHGLLEILNSPPPEVPQHGLLDQDGLNLKGLPAATTEWQHNPNLISVRNIVSLALGLDLATTKRPRRFRQNEGSKMPPPLTRSTFRRERKSERAKEQEQAGS